MTRYAIGLGSNLGDRLAILREAVCDLSTAFDLAAVSPLYESAPVGGPEQGAYLNAVAIVVSDGGANHVLSVLHSIEAGHGRERLERWGPRTLDLDIIATDGAPVDSHDLTIPHPRAAEREFVLRPLVDVWPEADVGGINAVSALELLADQGVDRLEKGWVDPSAMVGNGLVAMQVVMFVLIGFLIVYDGDLPDSVGLSHLIGLLLAIAGLALALPGSLRLRAHLTAHPRPHSGSELIESGPFALVRHPIYGGVALFFLGGSVISGSLPAVGVSIALLAFFWVKSDYEERLLRAEYAAYRHYRGRVRRRLVPFIL